MEILRYNDDRDKAYGIAGMVVALKAIDEYECLSYVDMDAEASESVVYAIEYGLRGNPRMSAKLVWQQIFKDLRVTGIATVGNLYSRRVLLGHRRPDRREYAALCDAFRQDAAEHLSLDEEEVQSVFDMCCNYVERIFSYASNCDATHSLASRLVSRRRLSASELSDVLAQLGLR